MPREEIDWHNITPFNGSKDGGFEELCKQLYRSECEAAGAAWIPTGVIDGGVEGYGVFANGDEWALQAKWYLESPRPAQWRDVRESAQTALQAHPRLVKYAIYLPQDLSDARQTEGTTAQQRWQALKAELEADAAARGMRVLFDLRGSSSIVSELVKSSNAGLRYYFFGGANLSAERIRRRIEDTLNVVGERYSKTLNVETPLAFFIDALLLSRDFIGRAFSHYRAVDERSAALNADAAAGKTEALRAMCDELLRLIEPLSVDSTRAIPWPRIAEACERAHDDVLRAAREVDSEGEAQRAKTDGKTKNRDRNPNENTVHELYRFASALAELQNFAEGLEAKLSRDPYMLLVGEAGSGKTHFLCDSALKGVDAGSAAIIVLGAETFADGSLWGEIARRSALPSDHEVLLGALQASAEAAGTRALLLVDGINEGPAPRFWREHLAAIVEQVKRYPRVALVVSVRDSYEQLCIREDAASKFMRVVHEGFGYDPHDAQQQFFKNFGIEEPAEPLLLAELSNPLFLLLLCKGIKQAGLSEIPRGMSGITSIFAFFVESLNKTISADDIDADPDDRLVNRAMSALANELSDERPNIIERSRAKRVVDEIHASETYSKSLFFALERRGVIAKMDTSDDVSYVRFTYERMADHQRAARYLESLAPGEAGDEVLRRRLAEAADEGFGYLRVRGFVEALYIQVPETRGTEVVALLPELQYDDVKLLLETLPWRRPESIPQRTFAVVMGWFDNHPQLRDDIVESLLTCALIVSHPFNADGLHGRLLALSFATREARWTVSVSKRQDSGRAAERLTSWALNGAFGARGVDAAIFASTTLLWLCASSNRRVRDRATKAVVSLLDRVPVAATSLFERFADCNDPYVVQRLYAVLAGHAMRSDANNFHLATVATAILARAQGLGLPVDVLARDFARTVVERAVTLGVVDAATDVRAVRPPYGASAPDLSDSDDAFFESYSWEAAEGAGQELPRGIAAVRFSLSEMGDFARYVVGTNSSGDWLDVPISQPPPLSRSRRRELFEQSLSARQKKLRASALATKRLNDSAFTDFVDGQSAEHPRPEDYDAMVAWITSLSERFTATGVGARLGVAVDSASAEYVNSLSNEQQAALDALDEAGDFPRYDLKAATRWLFRNVIEGGYGGDEVLEFDEQVWKRQGRDDGGDRREIIERIGKKHQWIAFFAFVARMADNFYLADWNDAAVRYDVPLDAHRADIDPSSLLESTRSSNFGASPTSWWSGPAFDGWRLDLDADAWMRKSDDLPDVTCALALTDADGVEWIALYAHLSWAEKEQLLRDKYSVPRRELWYLIFGYLVPKTEAERVYNGLRRMDFQGRTLDPEPGTNYELLWGDLYWSPAFRSAGAQFEMAHPILENASKKSAKNLIQPASTTLLRETGDDCSIKDSLSIQVPLKEIVEGLGGVASDAERGAWLDASGRVVAFDPSVAEDGPKSVLVRRREFEEYLRSSPFGFVWTLLSEKQIVGGRGDGPGVRLITSGAYRFVETVGEFDLAGGKTPRVIQW